MDALLDHPQVRAVSFVGSTQVARYIYSRASANGKRAQCQGGAKNPVVVLPDADLEMTRASWPTAPSAAPGSAAWRPPWRSRWARPGRAFTEAIAEAARQAPGGLRPGCRRADGPGDHPREQGAHRKPDRRKASPRAARCWWTGAGRISRVTSRAISSGRRSSTDLPLGSELVAHRDLRPGAGPDPGRQRGGGHRVGQPRPLRQYGLPVHQQRGGGAASSATRPRPATSASISGWRRRWPSSPSAAGRTASSATCTPRAWTASSSTPRRKW